MESISSLQVLAAQQLILSFPEDRYLPKLSEDIQHTVLNSVEVKIGKLLIRLAALSGEPLFPPTPLHVIRRAEEKLGFTLPPQLKAMYRFSNGFKFSLTLTVDDFETVVHQYLNDEKRRWEKSSVFPLWKYNGFDICGFDLLNNHIVLCSCEKRVKVCWDDLYTRHFENDIISWLESSVTKRPKKKKPKQNLEHNVKGFSPYNNDTLTRIACAWDMRTS